jgi:hypothetical protein
LRNVVVIALVATLAGCSHPTPQVQAVADACSRSLAFGCSTKAHDGPQLEFWHLNASSPSPLPKPASVHKPETSPHHRARANVYPGGKPKHAVKTTPKRVRIAAKSPSSRLPIPRARPSIKGQIKPGGVGAAASTAKPKVADSHAATPWKFNSNSVELQVAAATAMAEQMTLAMAGGAQAKRNNGPSEAEAALHGEAGQSATDSPDNTDLRVAILLVRPETRSLSDLTGKKIAIDEKYAGSTGHVRVAIVAAGAPVIEVTSGQAAAINRLMSGEVPAAVLALVSPDAAEVFPEIAGFRTFHIPLSPRSTNARP